MNKSWLTKKTTIEELEAKHMVSQPELGPNPVLFGHNNAKWLALQAQMQPGDELWYFDSGGDSWAHRAGRSGVALVRNGEVVDSIIRRMN